MIKIRDEALLLELCKPYFLELMKLLIESIKYPDEPASELAEGTGHISHFSAEVLKLVSSLEYRQKTSVLHEIANWIDTSVYNYGSIEESKPDEKDTEIQ